MMLLASLGMFGEPLRHPGDAPDWIGALRILVFRCAFLGPFVGRAAFGLFGLLALLFACWVGVLWLRCRTRKIHRAAVNAFSLSHCGRSSTARLAVVSRSMLFFNWISTEEPHHGKEELNAAN